MEKSKAQLKREKQLRERLTSMISRTLRDFKDKYLGDYTAWNIAKMESELNWMKEEDGKPYPADHKYYAGQLKNHKVGIQRLEGQLSRMNTLQLKFLSEANEGYDRKFERMIEKLVGYNFSTRFLKVEMVSNIGHELAFLISNDEMECHARVIYAQGAIKAPHYRFITTVRNKK